MRNNVQGIFSPTGTGKSTVLIPSVMLNNSTWSSRFIVFTEEESQCIKTYKSMCRNMKQDYKKVDLFDTSIILSNQDCSEDIENKLISFIMDSDVSTNIIIDEASSLFRLFPKFKESLKGVKCNFLTIVSQRAPEEILN